jgi:hypothetical protein
MRVERLSPCPDHKTQFAWSSHVTVPDVTVPDQPGCYALATYHGDVLYVGLATVSIRSRMGNHFDTAAKRRGSDAGVPFWFYYLVWPAIEVAPVERGWMNQAVLADGEMPPLNKVYSPI